MLTRLRLWRQHVSRGGITLVRPVVVPGSVFYFDYGPSVGLSYTEFHDYVHRQEFSDNWVDTTLRCVLSSMFASAHLPLERVEKLYTLSMHNKLDLSSEC